MDNAIPSQRLYPAYTAAELRKRLAGILPEDVRGLMELAVRQRDPASPDYVKTLHERLNPPAETVDTVTEYGLTQRLSRPIRVF